tara:strand:+ start:3602 stop:3865 length:264 start_codon:yes stop_codon:yes gene_type:complete
MRRFVIEAGTNEFGGHSFNVIDEYGRETQQLCFGELLEQITELCHPRLGNRKGYAMLTPEQWDERARRQAERFAAQRAAENNSITKD